MLKAEGLERQGRGISTGAQILDTELGDSVSAGSDLVLVQSDLPLLLEGDVHSVLWLSTSV